MFGGPIANSWLKQDVILQQIAEKMVTCQEVVDEIRNKRQLRRLVVLPYDLEIKHVFPENVQIITEFSKKTGDYPSLSLTDIKVMALTYQLEREKVGTDHLRTEPVQERPIINTEKPADEINPDITGFFLPGSQNPHKAEETEPAQETDPIQAEEDMANELQDFSAKFEKLNCNEDDLKVEEDILMPVKDQSSSEEQSSSEGEEEEEDEDVGWITPANIAIAKKQVNSQLMEEKHVQVACITTDFAMQNVLKQMNLNVSALDGRMIKQLRTYILRCYTCFKTTSIMTKKFCPKCGNNTLKRVGASVDENGKMQIHINSRRPLTGRGKKFSLPRIQGGKHPNNPILVEDQPMPDNRPTRLARMKCDPLDDDYIAGNTKFLYILAEIFENIRRQLLYVWITVNC